MTEKVKLPEGWQLVKVKDIISQVPLTKLKLPQREYLVQGKYPVIDQGKRLIGGYTNEELLVPCELPVIIFGDHTKTVKYVNFPFVAGADGIKVIKPNSSYSEKLFFYFLMAIQLPDKGYARHFQYLEKEHLPLPPLDEQERIVAKIESLFSQLDAGVAALQRIRAALKRYKASVLKAAFEGRLVPQDPDDEPAEALLRRLGKAPVEDENLPSLPEGWCWTKLSEIAEIIGGITKGRNLIGKQTISLPYLRVANVQRGQLNLTDMKEIELLVSEISKYKLVENDVVLTEGGDWDKLGRSAVWKCQIPNCVHQNHIFRARIISREILPEWLCHYTNSDSGQAYFKEAAKQTTNLASINLSQLKACPIPIAPFTEQQRIISDVENRLSIASCIEKTINHSLSRFMHLRQAILKQAFEGRLVTQNNYLTQVPGDNERNFHEDI